MKKTLAIVGLTLASLAGQVQAGMNISYFNDGTYVDTSNESIKMRSEIVGLGHTPIDFGGTSDSAWSTAMGAADVLVVPELEKAVSLIGALSGTTQSNIQNFVSGGGRLVIAGSGNNNDTNLLNSIFGWSLVGAGGFASGSSTFNPTEAAGTAFAGGPGSLSNVNGTFYVTTGSLPGGARNLYSNAFGTSVFNISVGGGSVTYVGYDWFTSTRPGDWGLVLDSAFAGGSGAVPEPASLAMWGLGALGACVYARRRKRQQA